MDEFVSLESYLGNWQGSEPRKGQVASVVLGIARAAAQIAERVRMGRLAGPLNRRESDAPSADVHKELDRWASARLLAALEHTPVALVASERLEQPVELHAGAPLAVAMDPLDRSSNIDTNVSIGTLFSVLPTTGKTALETFLQPGSCQLAAGYIIYGPHCALALSLGSGTQIFTLDGACFRLTHADVATSKSSNEYAINASNYRFWSESIRAYIDDCIAGSEGARGADVSMRWIGSLVAECHRILVRGGAFLYPRDSRRGNERGRLRLVYDANPIAFLVENAGGKAIDGFTRILELVPTDLHQRTPLIFGSASEIDRIARYKANPSDIFERSPLFGQRGLLKV